MELGVNFINAVKVLADERNLSEEEIFASVEEALALTYKKFRSTKQQPVVKIDRRNGDVIICDVCKVTDEEEPGENEVTKARAAELGYPNAVAGDSVEVPVLEQPEKFGRVAAQTARQQIVQKLKDAERKIVYNEFNDKKGDLVSATIFKMEDDQVIVRLPDHNEAVLPREERISGEEYKQGETMKFFLLDVRQSGRGAKIFVSRTHPSLLRKLLEVEILRSTTEPLKSRILPARRGRVQKLPFPRRIPTSIRLALASAAAARASGTSAANSTVRRSTSSSGVLILLNTSKTPFRLPRSSAWKRSPARRRRRKSTHRPTSSRWRSVRRGRTCVLLRD